MIPRPEGMVDEAIDRLRAWLPARIAELNNESGAVYLSTPGSDDYHWGTQALIPRWPAVEVAVPTFALGNFDLAYERGDANPLVAVIVGHVEHTDPEVLARANYRFGGAILDVMLVRGSFGPSSIVSAVTATFPAEEPESRTPAVFRARSYLRFDLQVAGA